MSCVATLYENGVPGGVGSSFSVSLLLPDGATGPLVSDVKDLAISKVSFQSLHMQNMAFAGVAPCAVVMPGVRVR